MTERKTRANKILVLGIDGMDPRLTKKYVAEGKMPNVKKFIEKGAQREDLVLLGSHPTVTPPMWTTLSTGAHPVTHGITCFFRQSKENLDEMEYNLDSRLCQAEQAWNCFAEAGKKTLVWHWPGCSWPPTSDSENLYVVDGTSPGGVNQGGAQVEREFILGASEKIEKPGFKQNMPTDGAQPCIITGLDIEDEDEGTLSDLGTMPTIHMILTSEHDGMFGCTTIPIDIAQSPIKMASGWNNAPKDAKEFTLLLSKGFLRRPCLILKNEIGIYDHIAIYKNKKAIEPIVVLSIGHMERFIVDESIKNEITYTVNRSMKLLELEPDGSQLKLWVSSAMDMHNDTVWHPKKLFEMITTHIGYPPPVSQYGNSNRQLIEDVMLDCWDTNVKWQGDALNYLIEHENFEIIFSHFHNIDIQEHMFIRYMKDKGHNVNSEEENIRFMENLYIQTDNYLGQFLHLLNKGWTIFIVSDHAQVCPANDPPLLGDISGLSVPFMKELGWTVLKKDENGNEIPEIDWSQTKAINQRACHIYLNIKGRDKYGIIEPEDQYEMEEQLMTDLYGYKDPKTGKRVIALALRNKDAVLLGMGGPECGDILIWTAEGYNWDHADSLSTTYGEAETSVSPIFIAAGKGLKKSFSTTRIIRQVDVAPTLCALGGVRYPAQCEGAPIYQIFAEEL